CSHGRSATPLTDPPTSSYTPVTEGSGVRPTGYHAPRVEFTGECPRYSPANSTFGTRATIDRPKILYRPSSGTTKVTWPSSGTTSVTPARHPLHPRLASAARVRTIADRHSWRRSLAVVLTSSHPASRRRSVRSISLANCSGRK